MSPHPPTAHRHRRFFSVDDVDVADLRALVDTVTPRDHYPNADAIEAERYEEAAQLRDELRRLEEPPPPTGPPMQGE